MKFLVDRIEEIAESGIREMYNLTRGLKNFVHLEMGDPDFPIPPHIIKAAKKALYEEYTHYTPNAGYEDLRERIAEKLWKENRMELDPHSQVIVTAGSMQALSLEAHRVHNTMLDKRRSYEEYRNKKEGEIRLLLGILQRDSHETSNNRFSLGHCRWARLAACLQLP